METPYEGKGRMSARWRRSRRHTKWVSIAKAANGTKNKNVRRILRIQNVNTKKQSRPSRYKTLRIYGEKVWKEPRPLADVLEENDEIVVVTEFAGFKRENLKVNVREQRLTLSAENPERRYYKSLNLPKRVIPETIRTKAKNGVLEIRLKKGAEERTIDKLAG